MAVEHEIEIMNSHCRDMESKLEKTRQETTELIKQTNNLKEER